MAGSNSEAVPEGLPAGGFVGWEDFRRQVVDGALPPFDVVFHDLASGTVREDAMPVALQACRAGGLVLFDDAHREAHRRRMKHASRRARARLFYLRWCTLDPSNRYAALAVL